MKFDIARAWKDASYRASLSEEQLRTLPANPAGELTEDELAEVAGAGGFPAIRGGVVPAVPAIPANPVGHAGGFAHLFAQSLSVVNCQLFTFSAAQAATTPTQSLVSQNCIEAQ